MVGTHGQESTLGSKPDVVMLDSNLAIVINILVKENFKSPSVLVVNSFEIERKIVYNNLHNTRQLIEEHSVYFHRVDNQYSILDSLGSNKSLYLLQSIIRSYVEESNKNPAIDEDSLFGKVVDNVIDKVLSSANYSITPLDELEFCVSVLVVDAFVRCKVLKTRLNINMLRPDNIHPQNSIHYNGAIVLRSLQDWNKQNLLDLYQNVKHARNLSFSLFILCLDWLYLIDAAQINPAGEVSYVLKNIKDISGKQNY